MGKNWDKFILLTWKNWLLQWRHPLQTLLEVLAPVLFSALLVLIRSLVDPENNNEIKFTPFELDNSTLLFNRSIFTRIAWSPCNNSAVRTIMTNLATDYQLTETCQPNSNQLNSYLRINTLNRTIGGVQFDDSLIGKDTLDKNIHVTIRFPAELRSVIGTGFGAENWRTNLLYPLYQIPGPRSPNANTGASPEYFNESFLVLQHDVSAHIIKYLNTTFHNPSKDDELPQLPQVLMQRFSHPAWTSDPLLTALESFVGIIIMLSFVYTCINTVKVITTEKEKQLKEAMKIMGLPNWLHWTAWFLKTFFFLLIAVILIVILLKVSWYPDTEFSVFTLADPLVMLLFLIIYMCATITFCFAISVFFSKANTAATVAGLAWFISYCPYLFLQERYNTLSLHEILFACLGSNTAMAYGFQVMLMFEGTGEGLQWNNIFRSVTPDDELTFGFILLMLIFDSLLYLVIALYVEAVFPGNYGIPQVWYFPFTASYWCGETRYTGVEHFDKNAIKNSDVYEKEPSNLLPGIKIKHLKKVFSNKKVAVRDLSLNMYKDQITVLLGHNGAGKTTTMSMLTGMYPPSNGTAVINGFDIRSNMSGVRDSLGLCPQHNILFDELTVKEHLYFFSKLKGMSKHEIESEIKHYIELLELIPKTNAKAKTLSGGMKRKVCVGMALCGKSKIVMLDEPTAGMDPSARRAVWELLQIQKKDRTLLLTTHFMDEADLLGDRIAIMAGGQLQCCGSSFFLKKKYGAGYHLIMDKSSKCDVDRVTNLLKVHIPHIKVEHNVGSELTYILPEDDSSVFEEMLSDLENNSTNLGINTYGISLTTLEEVFMKVGADHGQEEANDVLELSDKEKHINMLNTQNGHTGHNNVNSSDTKLNMCDRQFLTGFPLRKNQFLAMMMKRMLSTLRSWILFVIQNIIPVAFLIIAIVAARGMDGNADLPNFDYTLDSYDSITVMDSNSIDNIYYKQYRELLKNENRNFQDLENGSVSDYIIQRTIENSPAVRLRYIIGASFTNDTIIGWFNNDPYHSPPLTLQYIMNTILKQTLGSDYSIQISNHPLPFDLMTQVARLEIGTNMGFQLAFNISFCMAFVASFYVLFYIRERVIKSKHLQFVSGVEILTFWLSSYLWDIITFIFTSLCLIITMACFQEDGFKTAADLGRMFVVLICFGIAMLPMMYLSSFIFEIPSTGFSRMTLINIFTGVAAFLVVQVLSLQGLDLEDIAEILHWVFLILPHYALATAIYYMHLIFSLQNLCATINKEANIMIDRQFSHLLMKDFSEDFACLQFPDICCDLQDNYFAWDNNGIGRNIVFLIGCCIVLTTILLLKEYRLFDKGIYKLKQVNVKIPPPEENEDSDVLEEKQKIRNGEINAKETGVFLKDITKYYKNFVAVNQISVGINSYECFGLLGVNGAGKTSTFKMMTGDVKISSGEAWINGFSIKSDIKKVHKYIGYCPQFDALLDDLTGRETLIMYCMLRGISLTDSKYVSEQLAKDFDFHRHIDKKVQEYSGGNKRKLSAAVALIGDPPIIFLDEPTTGMDPATKRNLWNTLCKIRDNGKCLVLTSHSMEECEALCTRLAIMVNGVFKCLGSTQHLKNKFSQGYTLTIKISKILTQDTNSTETEPIETFVKSNFPSAILREKHQELITFYIPEKSIPWSRMFGIMERGKESLNLEDYSLGQSSLEQIFLSFTKLQRDQEDKN